MHVLNNATNEYDCYNIVNNSTQLKTYLYCRDVAKKHFYYNHVIRARKIELINNYFTDFFETKTNIQHYMFNLNITNYNSQNYELLIATIANKVKTNINIHELLMNFSLSLLGVSMYDFACFFAKNDHITDEDKAQNNNQLNKLIFNGLLLTLMQTGISIVYEKIMSFYDYTSAKKYIKTDDNFMLKITDNANFSIKYPFQHIDIVKIIYIIKNELGYNHNEVIGLYKIISLSIMNLWIEDNLLIEENTDITTRLIQKIITMIIQNNCIRESILLNKETGMQFKQAINFVKNENTQIKKDITQKNYTTFEQQEYFLSSVDTGCYSVLGSNLLLFIKKSFLGKKIFKIYNPILQVEVSTESKYAVNDLFENITQEVIFKKIIEN